MQLSRGQWALIVVIAGLGAAFAIGLWQAAGEPSDQPERAAPAKMEPEPTHSEAPPKAPPTEGPANEAETVPPVSAELLPREVIGNIDCDMTVGRGATAEAAVVVVPSAEGARFSVLGANGALVSDTLPFRPHIVELGVGPDGVPVVGLGDLRRNSNTFRDADSPEPVRIMVGNRIAYQSDKAWDFVVASDGSSFAVQEPLAGGGSRLIVRNLQTGAERHFDLGTRLSPHSAYERSHILKYSLDRSEIMSLPAHSDGMGLGTYWFFPSGEGKVRRIDVEQGMSAVMASSSEGYFVDQPADLKAEDRRSVFRVTKRRLNPGDGSIDDVWSRTLDLDIFGGDMFASDDGKWLALDGWDFHVLDAGSGEVAFRYPTVGSVGKQLARLGSVVDGPASASDLGSLGGIWFRGGDLVFFRKFGRSNCFTPPGGQYDERRYRACLRSLRESGAYRAVYDVYDMERITLDATPAYRTEVFMDSRCVQSESASPVGSLKNQRGRLVFVSSSH